MAKCNFCGAEIENSSDTICQYCGNPLEGNESQESNFGYGASQTQQRFNTQTSYGNQYSNPYQNPNQSNYGNPYQNPNQSNFGNQYRNPYNNQQFYAEDMARSKVSAAKTFAIIGFFFNPLFLFSILAIKGANEAAERCPMNDEIQRAAKSAKSLAKISIIMNIIYVALYTVMFAAMVSSGTY